MNIVFLPATEPDDATYGAIPAQITGHPGLTVHQIRYPTLVWYNESVCNEAIAQIRALDASPVTLVGFSKSGLGAWNITRAMPDIISATIIFDSPVAREQLPTWGTSPFYADDTAWQKDLPHRSTRDFAAAVDDTHQLVLISGPGFHEEMRTLSRALSRIEYKHVFLDRSGIEHHWNSGWIEEGLDKLSAEPLKEWNA